MHCGGGVPLTPNAVQSCTFVPGLTLVWLKPVCQETNQNKMPFPLKSSHRNIRVFLLLCFGKLNYVSFSDLFLLQNIPVMRVSRNQLIYRQQLPLLFFIQKRSKRHYVVHCKPQRKARYCHTAKILWNKKIFVLRNYNFHIHWD